MGTVWRSDGKAVKVMPYDARGVQEARLLGSFVHSNIINYHRAEMVQSADGHRSIWLWMELARHGTLRYQIKKRHGRPIREIVVIRWLHDLCSGLLYLHARGVVHGDIKPAVCVLCLYRVLIT